MDSLVLHEDRDLRAYACLGRGADFAATIHEWSGQPDDVLALVRAHYERLAARGAAEVFLLSPPDATAVHAAARRAGAREMRGILALAKPLDVTLIADLVANELRGQARVSVESQNGAGSTVVLQSQKGSVKLANGDWIELLAPPRGDCARIGELELALDVSFETLPLAPFVWGLDSI
jgi:hypothetical protein